MVTFHIGVLRTIADLTVLPVELVQVRVGPVDMRAARMAQGKGFDLDKTDGASFWLRHAESKVESPDAGAQGQPVAGRGSTRDFLDRFFSKFYFRVRAV